MKARDGDITIRITSGTIVKTVLILAGFYFLYLFKDLVLVILTAVVIASAIEPATQYFAKYKIPRVIGVIIVYGIVTSIFAGLMYSFIPPVIQEIVNIDQTYEISETVSTYVGDEENTTVSPISNFSLQGVLQDLQSSFSNGDPENTFQTISSIFGGLFGFILIVVISFYLSVQQDGVKNFLRIITPNVHEGYIIDLWQRTQKKIGLWMQGQLLLGLIVGVLVYLGLTLMQVPYALVLAVIAGLFEIIPIFGPVLAAIPAVLLAYIHGISFVGDFGPGLGSAVAVALFYVIIQQFENHLIYPLVVRKVVGVSPLLVIIALVVGVQAAGFLGVVLAVPIAAALMEYMHDIQKEKSLAKKTA